MMNKMQIQLLTLLSILQILEFGCARESEKLYEAGALHSVMNLIITHGDTLFKDTIKACMTVTSRLVSRVEPTSNQLNSYVQSLSILSQHTDPLVREQFCDNHSLFVDISTSHQVFHDSN